MSLHAETVDRPSDGYVAVFQRSLLDWFEECGRDYPWRRTNDPYKILVAELMLQRTGAAQVVPVYESFTRAFPDLSAAIAAEDDEIRSLLFPLGRVGRLTLFRLALETIAGEFSGSVPQDLKDLLRIPGVGMYTARAVMCFAHGRDVAVLDNNVVRILERVFEIRSEKTRPHTDATLWERADSFIPEGKGRPMNFAVLDLAALICRKKRPLCCGCPVESVCAYRFRIQEGDGDP